MERDRRAHVTPADPSNPNTWRNPPGYPPLGKVMPTQTYRAAQDTLARALTNNQHFVPEGTRDYAENRDMITEKMSQLHDLQDERQRRGLLARIPTLPADVAKANEIYGAAGRLARAVRTSAEKSRTIRVQHRPDSSGISPYTLPPPPPRDVRRTQGNDSDEGEDRDEDDNRANDKRRRRKEERRAQASYGYEAAQQQGSSRNPYDGYAQAPAAAAQPAAYGSAYPQTHRFSNPDDFNSPPGPAPPQYRHTYIPPPGVPQGAQPTFQQPGQYYAGASGQYQDPSVAPGAPQGTYYPSQPYTGYYAGAAPYKPDRSNNLR